MSRFLDLFFGLAALVGAGDARAQAPGSVCAPLQKEERAYVVCTAAPKADVRLFLTNADGENFGSFSAVDEALAARGEKLAFAMNAGMYDADFKPVGLYVENGVQRSSVNQRSGAGNFHLKPNGVFWVARDGTAGVTETSRFVARRAPAAFATQSGPMLVIDGQIHPRIQEDGTSRKIRNGVGACAGGVTKFAISAEPVTFHEFASLFRDSLQCRDALFLDGSISSIYAPSAGRHDRFRPMGPIVGLVVRAR